MGKWRRAMGCAVLCLLLLVPGVSVRAAENMTVDGETVEISQAYTVTDGRSCVTFSLKRLALSSIPTQIF
jgi:hypothetical protein